MRRTIENGFELTGPISRGDWATVDAHKAAIHEAPGRARPSLRHARGRDARTRHMRTIRSIDELRAAAARDRARTDDGRTP